MGALTLKTFSDELREWEFIEGEGIDPTDSFGASLRLSIRENQIFIAEPNDPNIPWLTDKGRLFFDGMFEDDEGSVVDWGHFFSEISQLMYFTDHLNFHKQSASSFVFAFENLSVETLNMLYLLRQSCSFVELRKVEGHRVLNDFECNYQINGSVEKPKLHMSTLGILLNTNPRYEGYVLNLNLRQRFFKGNFKLLNIGPMVDLTFPVYNLGSNFDILNSLGSGTHLSCQDVKGAKFPLVITNTEIFRRSDARITMEILKHVNILDMAWNGYNVLNHNLGSVGIQSLNKFLPLSMEDCINFFGFYFINASLEATPSAKRIVDLHLLGLFSRRTSQISRVSVDQNSKPVNKIFFNKTNSDVFGKYIHLPSNLFLEDSETYINTQGVVKRTTKLLHFKKNAKTNWQITRKVYASTKSLVYLNNVKDNALVNFDSINSFNFKNYVNLQYYGVQTLTSLSYYLTKQNSPVMPQVKHSLKQIKTKVLTTKIKNWLDDFFNGNGKDSFSYNSSVLVNCSKIARASSTNFF